MLQIKAATGQEFLLPQSSSDLAQFTLDQLLRYHSTVLVHRPRALDDTEAEITPLSYAVDILPYMIKAGAFWIAEANRWPLSRARDLIESLPPDGVAAIFSAVSRFLQPDEPPHGSIAPCFEFRGTVYYLPEKHLKGSTVIEFMEAVQLQHFAGDLPSLPKVIAILCRPKGERYDPDNLERRAKLFEKLPLSIAFEVGFFLHRLNKSFVRDLLTYSILQSGTKALKRST